MSKMVGKIFKLLPIYEGKDFNGNIVCSPDEARINFQKHIILLETEILGLGFEDGKVDDLLVLLNGMKKYKAGQHTEVKYCVVKAINICKKIVAYYKDGEAHG